MVKAKLEELSSMVRPPLGSLTPSIGSSDNPPAACPTEGGPQGYPVDVFQMSMSKVSDTGLVLSSSHFDSGIATTLVGPQEWSFLVHEKVLCRSPAFGKYTQLV